SSHARPNIQPPHTDVDSCARQLHDAYSSWRAASRVRCSHASPTAFAIPTPAWHGSSALALHSCACARTLPPPPNFCACVPPARLSRTPLVSALLELSSRAPRVAPIAQVLQSPTAHPRAHAVLRVLLTSIAGSSSAHPRTPGAVRERPFLSRASRHDACHSL
ncbi:Unknown protein, partial [Striga hermonthica]